MAKPQQQSSIIPVSQSQSTTSEKLKALLDLLSIKIVYYVDDENNLGDFDIQILIGEIVKVYELGREAKLRLIQFENLDMSLPKEGVIASLTSLWPSTPIDKKIRLYNQILQVTNSQDLQLDFKRTSLVVQQMPKEVIRPLSPSQWDTERTTLLSVINDGERALILFDEELKFAGGRFEVDKGQDLIVEVKKMGLGDKVICTLLTGQTTTKEELVYRNKIVEHRKRQLKEELDINDFFPLAKERLDDAEVFADGIKKTLINRYIETIKQHTVRLIEESYREATNKINDFDTYDFENTILKSSVKDGVWEPHTIIRISDIIFENELKKRMVQTNYVPHINGALKAAQRFSDVDFKVGGNIEPYSTKRILRHQEIYEPGSLINALRKPLENGDIFELFDDQYILVPQACDMAVRKKEGKTGLRTAKVATLLKIVKTLTPEDLRRKEKDSPHYFKDKYPLQYFNRGTTDVGIVDFTDYLIVDIDFLDLCVFNEEGECKININRLECRKFLSKTWESRYDILIERIKKLQAEMTEIKTAIQYPKQGHNFRKHNQKKFSTTKYVSFVSKRRFDFSQIEKAFYPKFIFASSKPIDNPVKVEADGTFDFLMKRTRKYKEFGATYLLEKYTKHLSRLAEPHDFAL